MNLIIFTSLIVLGSAAQLPNVYLPQKQGGGGGGGFQQGGGGGFQQGGGGGFQHSSFQSQQSQSFHNSGSFQGSQSGFSSGDTGNRRPQQEQEKNAQILTQDQEINENGFHYNFETSNGIRMEEAGNEVQSQGGFSYKGDDGNTYTVTFTAGEGGFQPQGAHLPVAPPIPQEILEGLQKNEKDEAAGIFDDGQYRPKEHGSGQNKPGGGSSSSGHNFGSSSHQSSFNSNSGYQY